MEELLNKETATSFKQNQILKIPDYKSNQFSAFVDSECYYKSANINVNEIVGSAHCDYYGLTWEEMLKSAKRIKSNINQYKQNPNYYTSDEKKDYWSFYQYKILSNGKSGTFVEIGNHRTAIAKFLLCDKEDNKIKNVTLLVHTYNDIFEAAFKFIEDEIKFHNSNIQIKMFREQISHTQDGDFYIKQWKLILEAYNDSNRQTIHIDNISDAYILADAISLKWFERLFSKNKYKNFV